MAALLMRNVRQLYGGPAMPSRDRVLHGALWPGRGCVLRSNRRIRAGMCRKRRYRATCGIRSLADFPLSAQTQVGQLLCSAVRRRYTVQHQRCPLCIPVASKLSEGFQIPPKFPRARQQAAAFQSVWGPENETRDRLPRASSCAASCGRNG